MNGSVVCVIAFSLAVFAASACGFRSDDQSEKGMVYESGGSSAALGKQELAAQEKAALAGDNSALGKVITHYLFGTDDPQGDRTSAMKWMRLGAERGLEGPTKSYLYLVSPADADCPPIIRLFENVDGGSQRDILAESPYVASCVKPHHNRR